MPFGFHLTMDTLPSAKPTSSRGQRGITPAFGYGSPHQRTRRTSTFLNNALLSALFDHLIKMEAAGHDDQDLRRPG
jgi:hypothetical protein